MVKITALSYEKSYFNKTNDVHTRAEKTFIFAHQRAAQLNFSPALRSRRAISARICQRIEKCLTTKTSSTIFCVYARVWLFISLVLSPSCPTRHSLSRIFLAEHKHQYSSHWGVSASLSCAREDVVLFVCSTLTSAAAPEQPYEPTPVPKRSGAHSASIPTRRVRSLTNSHLIYSIRKKSGSVLAALACIYCAVATDLLSVPACI